MGGLVGLSRVLELRVHGVSNTPPENVLGPSPTVGALGAVGREAQVQRVTGDAATGFYRWPGSGAEVTSEAYSWGQLTSGQRVTGARAVKDIQRALWTLLLPFAFANLALFARPSERSPVAAWLIRVLGLSLTITMVLAATGVGVDLVAWQCVDENCLDQIPGDWSFLANDVWSAGGRAMVVGLLAPFGLLALLGVLTWRSFQYEAELPEAAPVEAGARAAADPDRQPNPLSDETFWCGLGQVRRLATIHLATGFAVAVLVPVSVLMYVDPPAGALLPVAVAALVAAGLVVGLSVVALGRDYTRPGAAPTPGSAGSAGGWSRCPWRRSC